MGGPTRLSGRAAGGASPLLIALGVCGWAFAILALFSSRSCVRGPGLQRAVTIQQPQVHPPPAAATPAAPPAAAAPAAPPPEQAAAAPLRCPGPAGAAAESPCPARRSYDADAVVALGNGTSVIESPTCPAFLVATRYPPHQLHAWTADDDINFRLLRRFFLQRAPKLKAAGRCPFTVDAGCNHGLYSFFAAAHGHRVACFEIVPALAGVISLSTRLNNATGHLVTVHQRGVGARRDSQPFFFEDGSTHLVPGGGGERAEVHPIDDFVFEPVELLKVDVEGFEVVALQGAKLAIERYGVQAIFVEVGPARWNRSGVTLGQGDEVMRWVRKAGQFDAHVVTRQDSGCPGWRIKTVGSGVTDADALLVQQSGGVGTQPLGSGGVSLPDDAALSAVLKAMYENNWDCNFYFERRGAVA